MVNQRGYKTRANTPFQLTQIARILGEKEKPVQQKFGFAMVDTTSGSQEQDVATFACALKDKGLSYRDIVAAVNVQGLRGRTGKPFQLTQIARMLKATAVSQ